MLPPSVHMIALFERTLGLYAALVYINAYHQPGIEVGKKAAGTEIELQKKVRSWLAEHPAVTNPEAVAANIGLHEGTETVYAIMRRLQNRYPMFNINTVLFCYFQYFSTVGVNKSQ